MSGSRLLVANLGCEQEWYAGHPSPRRRPTARLAPRAAQVASALGTLMRVFARPGDRLWTPCPVDPRRLDTSLGLTIPELIHGALEPASEKAVLAWGESASVAQLRSPRESARSSRGKSLADRLWRLPQCSPAIAARINDRRWQQKLMQKLGCALPKARRITSFAALREHLQTGAADAGAGQWILKAPFSAAGRHRLRGQGETPTDLIHKRVLDMLERWGELVFEPWMPRVADHGCCLLLDNGGVQWIGLHSQHVDARGQFLAATVSRSCGLADRDLEAEIRRMALDASQHVHATGYRGPLGIDCWQYRDACGSLRLNPLGEINARMTMGLVAHALRSRVEPDHTNWRHLSLAIGVSQSQPTKGTTMLLQPAANEKTSALLRVASS